jgi:thiamine biosynthesis protein ThiI
VVSTTVVVHYQEITLKGKNRSWFLQMLLRNIRAVLAGLHVEDVRAVVGRIEVRLGADTPWDEVRSRLRGVPGIGHFARAVKVPATLDALTAVIIDGLRDRTPAPFRIKAHRADKRYPLESPAVERHIGARVVEALNWPVDLSRPQVVVRIDLMLEDAFVFLDREAGPAGLPVGTGGKAVCLLSGGIDSPVAAWHLIRRGVRVQTVHFHSYPVLTQTSQEKARELASTLARYQLKTRLYLVPFIGIQQEASVSVRPEMRVIIYRRMMLRLAEAIALRVRADALITGDVVGQVASQTLENMRAISEVATVPVLRPLVGLDKEAITQEAIRLGTYETSIIPDEDCCTLFTPRHPATRASVAEVRDAEAALDVPMLLRTALEGTVIEDHRFPGGVLKNDKMHRFLVQETRP